MVHLSSVHDHPRDRGPTICSMQVFEELGKMLEYKLFPPRKDGSDPRVCPACGTGRLFLLGTAQGGFVACSNYSEQRDGHRCKFKRTFTGEESVHDAKAIGLHPQRGEMIFLRTGKYGKYGPKVLKLHPC